MALGPALPQSLAKFRGEAGTGKSPEGVLGDPLALPANLLCYSKEDF